MFAEHEGLVAGDAGLAFWGFQVGAFVVQVNAVDAVVEGEVEA